MSSSDLSKSDRPGVDDSFASPTLEMQARSVRDTLRILADQNEQQTELYDPHAEALVHLAEIVRALCAEVSVS